MNFVGQIFGRGLVKRTLSLAGASVLALTVSGVPDASAQTLFDRLFGGEMRQRRYVEEPPPPPPPPAPKVSAPSYYTYKADPLVAVDFGKLIAAARQLAADANAPRSVTLASADAASVAQHVVRLGEPTTPAQGDPRETFADALSALGSFKLLAEKDIGEALQKHYQANPGFIWIAGGEPSLRALAALEVLGEAASHGLPADEYAVELPDTSLNTDETTRDLARFEMELSARVLRYVRDAHRGRVDPNRISGYHDFAQKPVDYAAVLDMVSDTFAMRKYLESWHPRNAAYAALRAELEMLRGSVENAIVVDPRTFLRPGESSPEFAKLLKLIEANADAAFLQEHGATLAAASGAETYSQDLVPLIKAVQQAKGLKPDGVIGPRSVAAIAGNSKADRLQKVIVAMEQLRWLTTDFGDRYVLINTPEFQARYVENGEVKLDMRTVVGKNATQTFFFQDQISYVEFHPYWGIPRSILVNKYLPKLYQDPGYLDRIGYEITDSKGRRVPSASVNWTSYGTKIPFDVRQPPGPSNSLGEMKIMFPNRHAIYMHDTPEKELFKRESRNFSNGCIRLQDPRGMAAAVLGWSREQVVERLKGGHGQVDLKTKVPVYVVYFTAWPQTSGEVTYSPDVYGRDAYVQKAMERVEQSRAPTA